MPKKSSNRKSAKKNAPHKHVLKQFNSFSGTTRLLIVVVAFGIVGTTAIGVSDAQSRYRRNYRNRNNSNTTRTTNYNSGNCSVKTGNESSTGNQSTTTYSGSGSYTVSNSGSASANSGGNKVSGC